MWWNGNNDLIYYFKNNTTKKDFNDFENGIELSRKIKSGEMKVEDAKELQNIFNKNLNEYQKKDLNQKSKKCIRKY